MGALSIGNGLRDLFVEPGRSGRGASGGVLFGIVFVGAAIFMGSKGLGAGTRIMGIGYVPFQIALAVGVAGAALFLRDALAPIFERKDVLLGAIFLISGLGTAGLSVRSGRGVLFSLLFAALGGFILVRALLSMAHGEGPDDAAD